MAMPMPMAPPPPGGMPMPMPGMDMPSMHAAFYLGHRAQVLFADLPGDRARAGMYVLCLLVVAALAALIEVLSAASRGLSHRRGETPRWVERPCWSRRSTRSRWACRTW